MRMTMAGRRVIDAIERTPLALPMALLTAAAAAFLAYAVPAAIVARLLAATPAGARVATVPFGAGPRALLMLALAALAGGAVWWLFHRIEHPPLPQADDAIDLFAPEPEVAPAPQLRRADAHPDAPARRPLFAASDLGTPMDDVDAARLPFGRAPLFTPEPEPDEAPAPPAPVPAAGVVGEGGADGADILLLDERYASASADESIAGLMARLERGLERRGAAGGAPVADDGLRLALDELRRMTSGR